jgi:hypothetical protein
MKERIVMFSNHLRRPTLGAVAFLVTVTALLLTAAGASAIPTPPFTQCPAIGSSPSCGVLIEFTDQGTNILEDPAVGPYDAAEDTLVGAQNDSSATVNSVTLSGVGTFGIPLFGFDGDGICSGFFTGTPAGCPFGPTGYEGPGTSFQNVSPDQTTGDVVFTGGLAPGASAYFSLEDRLSASLITVISLTPPTASNSTGTSHTVTATITKGDGTPVTGKLVTFSVVSGPDTGASGTCSPVDCTTDSNGQVTFTYTNNGTTGTDTISASFINDQGNTQSATATKTWTTPPSKPGRMTGGGTIAGTSVHHGFGLNCDKTKAPNNLEVNWGNGKRFHLVELTSATCSDDPAISEGQPVAGFDTYTGSGTGRYNGTPGATATWVMTDAGEPGKNDTVKITITDASGNVVLDVSGKLRNGNQQAHPPTS